MQKNKDMQFGSKPHTVSGILLYARTDESILPDNEYQMSVNKISVRTLDLNCEFPVITTQLNKIAESQFGIFLSQIICQRENKAN
jgi:5-methylcytosine-specific restriction enzyme subunit McrC